MSLPKSSPKLVRQILNTRPPPPSPPDEAVHAPPPTPDVPSTPVAEDHDTGSMLREVVPSPTFSHDSTPRTRSGTKNSDRSRERTPFLARLTPTLVLENSGSVARDHLASERTFLAYVRTSLTIATAGVGK
jgi:hypothetical protein